MEGLTWENAALARRRQRRNRRNAILALLGCLVVFATAYALTMPAISMTVENLGNEAANGDLVAASFGESLMSAAATPSASTQSGSILDDGSVSLVGANNWQIVNGEYNDNAAANKTESTDGYVRVQKNIIPTEVENEFYVYLSVDTKTEAKVTSTNVQDYLAQASSYMARTSNTFQDLGNAQKETLGGIVYADAITHGSEMKLIVSKTELGKNTTPSVPNSYKKSYVKFYYKSTEICGLYFYQSNSNGTGYLKLRDGVFLCIAEFKAGGVISVPLSDEAYSILMEEVVKTTATTTSVSNLQVNELLDTAFFKQASVVNVDGSYDTEAGVWTVAPKTSPQTTSTTTGTTGNSTTMMWNLNVAELLYKVTLDTTQGGFESGTGVYYPGQGSSPLATSSANPATVSYKCGSVNATTQFPTVSVKGLLYDLKVKKVDQDGAPLEGATFALTGTDGNNIHGTYNLEATSDANGVLSFSNLPWGTYTVSETAAPSGYTKSSDTKEVTLCQTTNASALEQSDIETTHMMLKDWESVLKFANEKSKYVEVTLKKFDSSTNEVLAGAQFELLRSDTADGTFTVYTDDPDHEDALYTVASGGETKGTVALTVSDGYYQLVEEKAPAGHIITGSPVTFQISNGAIVSESVKNATRSGNTLIIKNEPGKELPNTGGTGTLPYTLGGLALMATALVYGFRMRLRGRRCA